MLVNKYVIFLALCLNLSLFSSTESHASTQAAMGRALGSAASSGNVARLKQLLSNGHAPLEVKDKWGRTPLLAALDDSSPTCALLLIQAGARLGVTNARGEAPLEIAVMRNSPKIVQMLLRYGANVNASDKFGGTALILGADNPHYTYLLIKAGANVNANGVMGTPLSETTENLDSMRLLLDAGADPNLCPTDGDSPLAMAAQAGNLAAIQLLLDYGAEVNVQRGAQPISRAVEWGEHDPGRRDFDLQKCRLNKRKIADILFAHGADVHATSVVSSLEPVKPLMLSAASWAWPPMIQLLLKHGVDPNERGDSGETALIDVLETATPDEIAGMSDTDYLPESTRVDIDKSVELLLTHGITRDTVNARYGGVTALMQASEEGYPNCVKMFLQAGADSTFRNSEGQTALSCAESGHHPDVVFILSHCQAGQPK